MTTKLLVAYKVKPTPNFEKLMPEFEGRSGTKDPEKIKAQIAEKKKDFEALASATPYLGTFEEVCIADPGKKEVKRWIATPDGPPVSAAVGAWLMGRYATAWPWDIGGSSPTSVIFLGFEPRVFLKILGLECSMPPISSPLPPRLWFSNSDHRDLTAALIPTECAKVLDLVKVLERRRPETDGDKWDAMLSGWAGPGYNAQADLRIVTAVSAQLGFLDG